MLNFICVNFVLPQGGHLKNLGLKGWGYSSVVKTQLLCMKPWVRSLALKNNNEDDGGGGGDNKHIDIFGLSV